MTKQEKYQRLKYGLFAHYVPALTCDAKGSVMENINTLANAFDAEQFARDMQEMGMQYVIFTAWHFATVPLYPSKVMEKWRPGKCSDRDLIRDLIDSLKRRNIEIILYTHPRDGHDFSEEDRKRTGWGVVPSDKIVPRDYEPETWNQFINELYEEVVSRYHEDILGLFMDEDSPESDCYETIDYVRLRKTIKGIDKELVLLQNFYGSMYCCDFGMQEFGPLWNEFKNTDGNYWPGFCRSVAVVISNNWMAAKGKDAQGIVYSAEDLFRYTVLQGAVNEQGGGVAWSAGPYPYGAGWEKGVKETLVAVGRQLRELGSSFFDTIPSKAYPTDSGTCIKDLTWGVACTSRDCTKEYLHIFKYPDNGILKLAHPMDGTSFAKAALMNGEALPLKETGDGYVIELSRSSAEADIVIVLSVGKVGTKCLPEWINCTDRRIFYRGDWTYERWERCYGEYEGAIYRCTKDGSYFEFAFEGDRIELITNRHSELGTCTVYIDDVYCGTVTLFSRERKVRQGVFISEQLFGGLHKIRVVKKSGNALEINAIKIYS